MLQTLPNDRGLSKTSREQLQVDDIFPRAVRLFDVLHTSQACLCLLYTTLLCPGTYGLTLARCQTRVRGAVTATDLVASAAGFC